MKRRKPADEAAALDAFDDRLLRSEVARLLGISKSRVAQYEADHVLTSVPDRRGRRRLAIGEVMALAARREAEGKRPNQAVLTHLFQLFQENRSLFEIKLVTGLSMATLERLYLEYRTPFDSAIRERREQADEVQHRQSMRKLASEIRQRVTPPRDVDDDDDDDRDTEGQPSSRRSNS